MKTNKIIQSVTFFNTVNITFVIILEMRFKRGAPKLSMVNIFFLISPSYSVCSPLSLIPSALEDRIFLLRIEWRWKIDIDCFTKYTDVFASSWIRTLNRRPSLSTLYRET